MQAALGRKENGRGLRVLVKDLARLEVLLRPLSRKRNENQQRRSKKAHSI